MQGGIVIPETGPEAPPQSPTNERPAWLPENFKSPEDLANSYKSLQAEYTKLKQGIAPENDQGAAPATPEAKPKDDLTIDQKAAEAVTNAGLDIDKLSNEFMEKGSLSEESYKALEKSGISKELVDDYIRLKQGEAASVRTEVLNIAGGEESFQQMIQWASTNYADVDAYNRMITSGDAAQMRMAMTSLKAAYVAANGQDPSLVMGGNASGTIGDVYQSDLEMVADMQKAEYRNNPSFRREVTDKVQRSIKAGTLR